MSYIPRISCSKEKVTESTVDPMMALVRKTPLKPRPAKPPRKSKIPKAEKEQISNEMPEVKDLNEASNSLRQDIKDDCNSFSAIEEFGPQVISSELDGQVNTKSMEELDDEVNTKSMEELDDLVNTKSMEELDDQVNNFESNVEQRASSESEFIEELSDGSSNQGMGCNNETMVQFEMSEQLARLTHCLLDLELGQNRGSARLRHQLGAARDILQESLASPVCSLKSPLSWYDLATPGDSHKVKVREECLHLLQEMVDTSQRMTEMATKCKAGLTNWLSEENESEAEEYENEDEEEDYDEYSFPTFLANFFLVAAIVLAMILPPIFYKFAESETGLFNYLQDIFSRMSLIVHGQD